MYLFDISRICITFTSIYKEICLGKGYDEKTIKTQIERADHLERSSLLNKPQSQKKLCIPLSVKYNPMLPNLEKIIDKHWNILNINSDYRETFKTTPIKKFFETNNLHKYYQK